MKEFNKGKVTNFIKDCKPKYSPKPKTWFEKGGTIEIEINNGRTVWTYTNSSGSSVRYVDGYVQFPRKYFNPELEEVDIGSFTGDRAKDAEKLLKVLHEEYGLDKVPDGYVAHHDIEDGIIQFIRIDIHSEFTHIGGHSLCGGN